MTLFDGQQSEFRLYDAMRLRFIPTLAARRMTAEEAVKANEYYAKALCPHLQWKTKEEQQTKTYTVKR